MNQETINDIRSYLADGGTWSKLITQVERKDPPKPPVPPTPRPPYQDR